VLWNIAHLLCPPLVVSSDDTWRPLLANLQSMSLLVLLLKHGLLFYLTLDTCDYHCTALNFNVFEWTNQSSIQWNSVKCSCDIYIHTIHVSMQKCLLKHCITLYILDLFFLLVKLFIITWSFSLILCKKNFLKWPFLYIFLILSFCIRKRLEDLCEGKWKLLSYVKYLFHLNVYHQLL